MKTLKKKQGKSAMEQLREIRDNIGLEIQDMTYEELKKYIEKRSTIHPDTWKKLAKSSK